MKQVIFTGQGFGLVFCLQAQYPAVYQALVAQGLTNTMMEKDRTNATVIQAVEAARKSNPLAVRMNELYAAYKSYDDAALVKDYRAKCDELKKLLFRNARISAATTDYVLLYKSCAAHDSWDTFVKELELEKNQELVLMPDVEAEAQALFKAAEAVRDVAPGQFQQMATAYMNMRKFQQAHNCNHQHDGNYWYIEDGLIIEAYDERFLQCDVLDGRHFNILTDTRYFNEAPMFTAFVDPDIVKRLTEAGETQMLADYREMVFQVNRVATSYGGPEELLMFLNKYPNF